MERNGEGVGEGGMSPVVRVDGGGDKEGGHCYGRRVSVLCARKD